jgi:hypothetical protein
MVGSLRWIKYVLKHGVVPHPREKLLFYVRANQAFLANFSLLYCANSSPSIFLIAATHW